MKTSIFGAAAFALFGAGFALAQPADAPAPPSTRAEMAQRIQQRFAARDANHDGFLTADELGEMGPGMIAQADTDHDSKISLAEASAGIMAMFDRVDTNHDGTVSAEERAAAGAAMAPPAPPAPPAAPAPATQPQD